MSRPRSVRAHGQVLDAALELFAARGIDATSMDSIAEKSGVSKATIYKHWPDKDALCLEAMAHLLGHDQPQPAFDSGDVRADLLAVLRYEPPQRSPQRRASIMPHLMAYAARNPTFGKAWRERVMEPPRVQLTQVLQRGIAQGVLPRDLDPGLALAMLLGPLLYCHVMNRVLQGDVPANVPEQVVVAFWKAYGIKPPAAKRKGPRSKRGSRSQ